MNSFVKYQIKISDSFQFVKVNFVKIALGLLLLERVYFYIFAQHKLYQWLDYIIEQILAITR
uniref:Uncharacterized protein n=1 Tax=viral metagenome TaxID=1070528 RepID=A0A6M3LGB0_9ZZZZ